MESLFLLQILAQNRTRVGETVRERLKRLYKDHTVMSYKNARIQVYNAIDCENNKLWLEYSSSRYDWTCGGTSIPSSTVVNAEHTIPQSTFDEKTPMVSDVHHLFAAPTKLNSARSNYPFGEWSYDDCKTWCHEQTCQNTKPSGDMTEWSCVRSSTTGFMPRAADRGRVARAIFYFYTMYDEYSISTVGDVSTFKSWNKKYPPDSREIKRNEVANKTQGNRNPYVDDYTLVDQAW